MDTFGYSLLPAAAEAGLDTTALCRQMPLFRRVVGRDEKTMVVAPCSATHRLFDGALLMLVTGSHLVVTQRTKPLHRIRLYLQAGVGELAGVGVTPMPARGGVRVRFSLAGRAHEFSVRPGSPVGIDDLADAIRYGLAGGGPGAGPRLMAPGEPARHTLAAYLTVQPVRHEAAPAGARHFRKH